MMNEEETMKELLKHEGELWLPALDELIRLLSSKKFYLLSEEQIWEIGEYRPIKIEGKLFFERPCSRGKPVATLLMLAKKIGKEVVGEDLKKLKSYFADK